MSCAQAAEIANITHIEKHPFGFMIMMSAQYKSFVVTFPIDSARWAITHHSKFPDEVHLRNVQCNQTYVSGRATMEGGCVYELRVPSLEHFARMVPHFSCAVRHEEERKSQDESL